MKKDHLDFSLRHVDSSGNNPAFMLLVWPAFWWLLKLQHKISQTGVRAVSSWQWQAKISFSFPGPLTKELCACNLFFFIHTQVYTHKHIESLRLKHTSASAHQEFGINTVHMLRLLPQSITPEGGKAFKMKVLIQKRKNLLEINQCINKQNI